MATYTYINVSSFTFQYGAKSTLGGSNAGMRLNSILFKGFSLEVPKTLPATLVRFNAEIENSKVLLNWSTASEKDFSHFVIEKSLDGKEFASIAMVFSSDNPTGNREYKYIDKSNSNATSIYYRLKMVDDSKEFSYSPIVVLNLSNAKKESLIIFPNPATDLFHISMPVNWKGKNVKVEMYNLSGQRLQTTDLKNAAEVQLISLNSKVAKGIYRESNL